MSLDCILEEMGSRRLLGKVGAEQSNLEFGFQTSECLDLSGCFIGHTSDWACELYATGQATEPL